ncbi:NAD(P)H-dependent oxidoreductase [Clostridium chromiireducens]|uniref:NADPH-dependent FMN reductase n=1 Tax=Clostridium chromiireducens TaxID=225345 RepID=A0A1V4J164_9CLOT|nr:NAD(P)H-dependent oxidoreductase [Clostridium chromiireducens]OPJ66048.1 NADPH-dependent FMN reductase [Clostridium chromiireducens]
MNVTVIYGSMGKTSTYNCVQLLLNNLKLNINIKVNEFFLSQNYYDHDYYLYPENYLNVYSNTTIVNSIAKSLNASDLIIFASPSFTCDISDEMKLLLRSLSSHHLINAHDSSMHNKIGLAISTTPGAGLSYTTKILKKNLNYLGINKTFTFSKTLYEVNWKNISLRTKKQLHKKFLKLSYKILTLYNKSHNPKASFFNKLTSPKVNMLSKNNDYKVIDLNYRKKETYYHSKHI